MDPVTTRTKIWNLFPTPTPTPPATPTPTSVPARLTERLNALGYSRQVFSRGAPKRVPPAELHHKYRKLWVAYDAT